MQKNITRVAVVGLGMAAAPHIQSLKELGDRVQIASVWSPSESRREQARQKFDVPVADTFEQILEDRTISIVILLTPPMTHLELVQRCAMHGKHVLLEKPLDVTLERAREAVKTMQESNLLLGVVLQHRFRGASQFLYEMLHSGKLGAILSASASVRWWRTPEYYAEPGRGMKARDGGGVLMTQAIHTLDLFLSLTGPVREVFACAVTSQARKIDTEDLVAAAVKFDNGAVGTIDATTLAYPGFPERIELACEAGTAVLTGEKLDIYLKDGQHLSRGEPQLMRDGADPMSFSHLAHKALIADFLDAVIQKRAFRVSGASALQVHALIEALLQSSATRKPAAPSGDEIGASAIAN